MFFLALLLRCYAKMYPLKKLSESVDACILSWTVYRLNFFDTNAYMKSLYTDTKTICLRYSPENFSNVKCCKRNSLKLAKL